MEASITAVQSDFGPTSDQLLLDFAPGSLWCLVVYALAMSSTALAILLGCAVEDPKLGQEIFPILFVPQMPFAGFFVVPELIPVWLRWEGYLCSLTFAIRSSWWKSLEMAVGVEQLVRLAKEPWNLPVPLQMYYGRIG